MRPIAVSRATRRTTLERFFVGRLTKGRCALTAYADSMAFSRAGTPNAALAAYWADDAFAQRMICSQERRLTVDQVRSIRRLLAGGHSAQAIFTQIGGNDVDQIRRVIDGRTYVRVR